MNKLTLSLFFCCILINATAQHKLTADRNAYRAADQLVKQQVEFKDPGSSGKNLTWDFSMLQPINEDYKLDYFIPDSTQMERLCGQEHNTRYYYLQHADSLWAVGFENSTTYMEYPVPELKLRFPFSYGDTLFSFFEGKGQYSHRLELAVKGYTRVKADAEGDLKLPEFETVKKALRVRTLRHYTQTGKDSIEMTLDTYAWYADGIRYPVFESVKTVLSRKLPSQTSPQPSPQGEGGRAEGAGGEVDTTVFSTSFYYPPELQSSQVETEPVPEEAADGAVGAAAVFTEGQMQPNPVVDNLNINFKLTRAAKVWFSVHSNGGIPLCQTSPQNLSEGYNNTTVNMSQLITGTYTLYVHVDDMLMQRVVVKK